VARTNTAAALTVERDAVLSLDTARVRPFAEQPREYFDPGELISLELSIQQRGQLQPVMVRRITDDRDHDYELVDGQRRWHACVRLAIPLRAVVIDPENPEDQFEISVAANFQRAGHTPMETAKAIERMCTQGGRTEEYVGTLFGKSGAWVNYQRKLNSLVPEIQAQLEPNGPKEKWLSTAIAIQLGRLPKEQQLPVLEEIQARGLTALRATDKIRRILLNDEPEKRKKPQKQSVILETFVRSVIQRADMTLDRMGPDDLRLVVASLRKAKKFDQFRESVMTAIGRLEVLHRRLTECRVDAAPAEALPPPKVKPTATPSTESSFVYSHVSKCPKCNETKTRFKRRANADIQKHYWICEAKGCQLKISHYNIRVDTKYRPEAA